MHNFFLKKAYYFMICIKGGVIKKVKNKLILLTLSGKQIKS